MMKILDVLAAILLVVGGLNWGLVGLLNFDLVAILFGAGTLLTKGIYTVVGLAALYQALCWQQIQGRWCGKCC